MNDIDRFDIMQERTNLKSNPEAVEFQDNLEMPSPGFPTIRMRRTRQKNWSRRLVQEMTLSPNDLIWPLFIIDGENTRTPIPSMPGVERLSPDLIVEAAKEAAALNIPAIAIFPYTDPSLRAEDAREAFNPNNLVCRTVRAVKDAVPDIGIICDVALDPYTSHGHDGLVQNGIIDNDLTIEALIAQSLNQAQAGCDILAPSDMMDGRIGAIRYELEAEGFQDTLIMSYTAKYASAFYGPFRDAVGCSSTFKGDKKSYQMDPANSDEAMREAELDVAEGADMLMVKPGLPYLDILQRMKTTFAMPTFVYQVSGEYAMAMAAVENGWLDHDKIMMENLLSFKRAGADGILTYFALKAAKKLNG